MAEPAIIQNLSHELAIIFTDFTATRYLLVAAFGVLVYDHFLTFADEVDLIWRNPTKPVACLFFFNRYFIPLVIIVDIFDKCGLGRNLPDKFCVIWLFVEGFLQTLCFGIAHVLVALRVRALYVKRPWVEWVLWLSGSAYLATTMVVVFWSLTTVAKGYIWNPILNTCIGNVPRWTFWTWVPALVFETVLFGLTAGRALYHHYRDVSLPIAKMLYRDGFLYFIVISACCVFNIITFACLSETLFALSKYFTFSFVNVMSSRLVLNLRSLRRDDESTYWGHNTTTAEFEMHDWPPSPRDKGAFANRGSASFKVPHRQGHRGSHESGRPLTTLSPTSAKYSTSKSASLGTRPLERSQPSTTREMAMDLTDDAHDRSVGCETDLGTVSIISHRRGLSRTRVITPLPPLRVKVDVDVDVDVDFDVEMAPARSSSRISCRSDRMNSPTTPHSWYGQAI